MQRAGQIRTVAHLALRLAPPNAQHAGSLIAELDDCPEMSAESPAAGAARPNGTQEHLVRHGQLAVAIRQRIEARLPGRVRDLVVRVFDDTVVLEGKCATYYTKQLAQHAALGILEDEQLENAIVVNLPR